MADKVPESRALRRWTRLLVGPSAVVTAGIVLLISYWLCRLVIDRRRLAAWTADWSLTGPRWTSRLRAGLAG